MTASWREHERKSLLPNLINYPDIFLEGLRKSMKILGIVGSQPGKTTVQHNLCSRHTYCHVMSEYRLALVW